MPVEKAPYINYTELTSYLENIDNGSEIPVFIVKTDKNVNVNDISPDKVLRFISYRRFKDYFSISSVDKEYEALPTTIKELDNTIKNFFTENSMYGMNDEYGLTVPYIYLVDVGSNPTIEHYLKALEVSEMKRKSTVVLFPNTEDVKFMLEVKNKIMEETHDGLLRIGYFAVSGQGKSTVKFAKGDVVRPTFNHHGYDTVVEGYLKVTGNTKEFYETEEFTGKITPSPNHIYKDLASGTHYKYENSTFTEVTLENLEKYNTVIEGFEKNNVFYNDSSYEEVLTPSNESAIYLMKQADSSFKAYSYKGNDVVIPITVIIGENELLYDSDVDYNLIKPSSKKEYGGTEESFDEYCDRLQCISEAVKSSRIGIVDKEHFGKNIARIASTPYYIEPGYLPFMSVPLGVFKERSKDERDSLFATGLIFNEDDYTLANPTPRICLATSTAWGVEDHDLRSTDSLIHARRNVDYHIRQIFRIIAPQLKRNETSVSLRHVKNQIDLYLDNELDKGTIQEYWFDLIESSYNPYMLLLRGRITPVNSTLAIEFENTVGSPYAIASDYV